MNTDTGHLVDMEGMTREKQEEMFGNGYEPVPDHLEQAAKLELMGKKETYVGRHATGSLSKHMRGERRKKEQAAKAHRRRKRCHTDNPHATAAKEARRNAAINTVLVG